MTQTDKERKEVAHRKRKGVEAHRDRESKEKHIQTEKKKKKHADQNYGAHRETDTEKTEYI